MPHYVAVLTVGGEKQSSATLGDDLKYIRNRVNKCLQGHADLPLTSS